MKEIELRTPNGLHDAYLLSFVVDYETRTLQLYLNWLVGTPDGETEEAREGYRRGTLTISDLQYFVIEAPGAASGTDAPSAIDGYETRPHDIERCSLPALSELTFRHSIFVNNWNSFIHFAGASAEIDPLNLLVRKATSWR
jgi:hypothetical protein